LQLPAVFIGDDGSCLTGNQFGTDVVRVGAQWRYCVSQPLKSDGTQVGDEAVVPDGQFVNLSAGAEMIVGEHQRIASHVCTPQSAIEFLLEGGEPRLAVRKKLAKLAKL
jgi:hypothetical protein